MMPCLRVRALTSMAALFAVAGASLAMSGHALAAEVRVCAAAEACRERKRNDCRATHYDTLPTCCQRGAVTDIWKWP